MRWPGICGTGEGIMTTGTGMAFFVMFATLPVLISPLSWIHLVICFMLGFGRRNPIFVFVAFLVSLSLFVASHIPNLNLNADSVKQMIPLFLLGSFIFVMLSYFSYWIGLKVGR
jgi:hypothetical protein